MLSLARTEVFAFLLMIDILYMVLCIVFFMIKKQQDTEHEESLDTTSVDTSTSEKNLSSFKQEV